MRNPNYNDVAWKNGYCFFTIHNPQPGSYVRLRIDPDTGEMVDISGAAVINSDVSIVSNALRGQEPKMIAKLNKWWKANRPDDD